MVALLGLALPQVWAQSGGPHPQASGDPASKLTDICARAFERDISKVADQSGYPSPAQVLELKERLKLTAEQETKVRSILTAASTESVQQNARLQEAEENLRGVLARPRPDESAVRAATMDAERARSEACLAQLMARLKTRDLLTDEQLRIYREARWGARQ